MICNGSLLKGTIKKYNHENSRSTQKLNKGALVWRLPALNHSVNSILQTDNRF